MDGRRFDDLTRSFLGRASRRGVLRGALGSMAGGVLAVLGVRRGSAQDEDDDDVVVDVRVGNGGSGSADASAGDVVIGDIDTSSEGNTITVGDVSSDDGDVSVTVDGGSNVNTTDIGIDASGGEALVDASGGDGNDVDVNLTFNGGGGGGGGGGPILS